MIVTEIGTPVQEALVTIGMQSEWAVIHIEYDTIAALPSVLKISYPTYAM